MAILKLKDEGDTYTGEVRDCTEVAGNFGQQVKLEFTNGDVLFMPADSANRQLLRCGFDGGNNVQTGEAMADYEAVAGNWLTISRDPNNRKGAKPYWGIRVADGAEKAAPKPQSRRAAAGLPANSHEAQRVPPPSDDDFGGMMDDGPDPSDLLERGKSVGMGREDAYFALARKVAAFQAELAREHETGFDLASINAMTFSIFNQR